VALRAPFLLGAYWVHIGFLHLSRFPLSLHRYLPKALLNGGGGGIRTLVTLMGWHERKRQGKRTDITSPHSEEKRQEIVIMDP
jgi:hypothetical protein